MYLRMCADLSETELLFAPLIALQLDGTVTVAFVAFTEQAYHLYVTAGEPVQVPLFARNNLPTFATPEIEAADVIAGLFKVGVGVGVGVGVTAKATTCDSTASVF